MTDSTWRAWAGEARRRGPRCPDLEILRLWVEGSDAEGAATDPSWIVTDAHVRQCARCSVEAEGLRTFFAPAPDRESDRDRSAREEIRDLLGRRLATGPLPQAAPSTSAAAPGARRRAALPGLSGRRAWLPALQAALAIGVGLALLFPLLRDRGAPPVPALDAGPGIQRGEARPRLLAPLGEQASPPRRFAWEAEGRPPGGWGFRLERVDGSLIWSTATPDPWVELPEEAAGSLHPGSRYIWRVQASETPFSTASAAFEIVPGETP